MRIKCANELSVSVAVTVCWEKVQERFAIFDLQVYQSEPSLKDTLLFRQI